MIVNANTFFCGEMPSILNKCFEQDKIINTDFNVNFKLPVNSSISQKLNFIKKTSYATNRA